MAKKKPKAETEVTIVASAPAPVPPAPVVAYTIKDSTGIEIDIYDTGIDGRPGWWKDVSLVRQLITALKKGHGPKNAAMRIGISKAAFYRFLEIHPHFRDQIEDFKEVRGMKLVDAIDEAISSGEGKTPDLTTVRWAAEKLLPEFAPKEKSPLTVNIVSMRERAKNYQPKPQIIDTHATSTKA